jgi:hypothetical protein
MIEKIVLLLMTSLASSLCFLGCHSITGYIADPRQSIVNMPHIMYKHPWLGNVAVLLSILVFILVPLNGWLIGRWIGMISLFLFWFIVSNPFVTRVTAYRSTSLTLFISNPFLQVIIGTPILIGLTIVNVILR